MNSEYIQNIRCKLQKRTRRLNSTRRIAYHFVFTYFYQFILDNMVIKGILDDLLLRYPNSANIVSENIGKRKGIIGDTEFEHAANCWNIVKYCALKPDKNVEFDLGFMLRKSADSTDILSVFYENYIEPLYEYIDESLDDQRAILSLLRRYKHKCEWFARDDLFKRWKEDTKWGERGLAQHLYEYLFDQGIDIHIEPKSASGEADLISLQNKDDPVVADAKIFDPDRNKGKSYIAKGFAQVYRYMMDYNEPFGYLIIYVTGKNDLKFVLKEASQSTPFVVYNNKVIFLITIDIFPHAESASKRGPLKPDEICEDDLIRSVIL